MGNIDAPEAREAFLNTLSPENQGQVLRRAERVGPAPDDADWLVAWAVTQGVARIESAVAEIEKQTKERAQPAPQINANGSWSSSKRSVSGTLVTFALALAAFAGEAVVVERLAPKHVAEVVLYSVSLIVGLLGSALFAWVSPYLIRPRKGR